MCKNLARMGCCLALLILLSGVQAFGQAGLGVAVGGALASGSSLTVGQTNQPAFILFTNSNAAVPQLAESVSAISINPSCKQAPAAGVACVPAAGDLGVFSIVGNTGSGASTCAGTTFTFGAPDANGTSTITPGFTLPAGSATTCRINFNINVLALPTADCNTPPVAGLQTCAGVTATAQDTTGSVAFGTGEGQPTFPLSCAAQIDKEIVCDGSTAWQDTDFNNSSGAQGCIGTAGSTGIRVRYRINNPTVAGSNALPITSCTVTESNAKFGNPTGAVFPINPSSTPSTTFFGVTTTPGLECTNARSGGEPNTATLNCTCASPLGPQTAPTVTDSAQFECCGVAVDKQVSCGGGPFVDVGFNDGATGSCTAQVGQAVGVRFLATNRGSLPVSCTLTDVPTGGAADLISIPAGTFGTIAAATTLGPVSATVGTPTPNTCTTALSAQEPDTGVLNCNFTPPAGLVSQSAACVAGTGGTLTLHDTDSAQIICQNPPNLLVQKQCIPSTTTAGAFTSSVSVTRSNDGTPGSTSCTITDTLYSSTTAAVNCATPQLGTASTVAVVPNPLLTSNNSTSFATGNISGLTFSACNTATVSCTIGGNAIPSSFITYVDPFAPAGTTPTAAKDDCPVGGGCFTRTPGYWGTHPDVAQQVITAIPGHTLFSCGLGLTNAVVPGNLSTTQDVCSVGTDSKSFNISVSSATGSTSPQQVQLARQCTAAALNLAASANPAAGLNCESALPGITTQFNRCCTGPTSVCAAGDTAGQINASNCIGILDAFNNLFDSTDFPSTLSNSPAEPGFCQDASGDGFLNFGAGRHYGPR
jgi:hypothetical protein